MNFKKLFKALKATAIYLLIPIVAFAALSVPQGGTGVATITGILQGNGTGAFTAASTSGSGSIALNNSPVLTTPFITGLGAGTASITYANTASTGAVYSLPAGTSAQTLAILGSQTFSGTEIFSAAAGSFGTSTAASTYNIGTGATLTATTKAINIGTAGVSGSTTNIFIGSSVAGALGTTTLSSPTLTAGSTAATFSTVNGISLTTGGSATSFLNGAGSYVAPFTLTTTGSSGAATFSAGTLNIPQYSGGASGLTVGTTTITSGASGSIEYNNAGVLGEMTTSGSGTVVALATSPVFVTPTLGVASATTLNKVTITAPATGSTLTIADGKTLTASGNVTLSMTGTIAGGGASQTFTLPATTDTIATLAATQTFTNKTLTSPTLTSPTLGVATATSINGLALTANATGFSIAGGTTSKTLTMSNTLTFAGTDTSTLNIGAGGTLGTAAFTAASAYEVPLTFSTGLTRSTNTITNNLLTGVAGNQTVIGSTAANGTLTFEGNSSASSNTSGNANLIFKTGNSGSTQAMTIANSGAVGIGTSLPKYNLHVQSGGDAWAFGGMFMAPADSSSGANYNTMGGNGGLGFEFYGTALNASNETARIDLGSNSTINFRVGNGSVASTSVMFLNSSGVLSLPLLTSNGLLKTSGGTGTVSVGTAGTDYTTPTGTETLTNKRINPRVNTITSSSTPTPAGDSTDEFTVTALAAGATFAAPTGTPVDGQKLLIRIKDNGSAQTLAWNAIYRASSDLALPTTTIISKTMYLGFVYNAADSKWDFNAYLNNF